MPKLHLRSAPKAASMLSLSTGCPKVRARGFSLVELMVALVIGLLGVIVMMNVFRIYEQQKRTTIGGDDALSSGAIALNGLQRDIQQAGLGLANPLVIGCTVKAASSSVIFPLVPLVPVIINPTNITGDVNTDTLMLVSGGGNGTVEGVSIESLIAGGVTVQAAAAFAKNDIVFAASETRAEPCDLSLTKVVADPVRPNVPVEDLSYVNQQGYRLFNFGSASVPISAPTVRAYRVKDQTLQVCDFINTANTPPTKNDCTNANASWQSIANNVVSMRAQYGRDTNLGGMDGIIDVWDTPDFADMPPMPVSGTASKNTKACGFMRVGAIRIALVARSAQPEKTNDWPNLTAHVTPLVPTWLGTKDRAIDLSQTTGADWPTWQDYRYRIFQTIVPIRNVTSQGVVSSC
jgi:type IV pilus assembly protein PilW